MNIRTVLLCTLFASPIYMSAAPMKISCYPLKKAIIILHHKEAFYTAAHATKKQPQDIHDFMLYWLKQATTINSPCINDAIMTLHNPASYETEGEHNGWLKPDIAAQLESDLLGVYKHRVSLRRLS